MSLMLVSFVASAQRDLKCYPVFQGKIVPKKQMVVTEARGSSMSDYKLDYYRGVTIMGEEDLIRQIASLVAMDAEAAPVKETETVGDMLTYALVQPASNGKTNRYLCYQARKLDDKWKLTLLYLEGPATLEDLRKTFEKQ